MSTTAWIVFVAMAGIIGIVIGYVVRDTKCNGGSMEDHGLNNPDEDER